MTRDKIKEILDMLNTIQEHLLALPDDMLLSIDPRDNESLDRGTQFIKSFNDNLANYTKASSKIETQIKTYFEINPEEEEIEKESINRQKRDRIIKELDKTQNHYLDENFTYKRPYGFILANTAYKGIKTWRNLYIILLKYLKTADPKKFANLVQEEKFVSKKGNYIFSSDKSSLRTPVKLSSGFYTELNLSANHICKNIKELLLHFSINPRDLKIYLREDRDAC